MQNIKPFFLIIAILAMLFVGCQNEQIGSESADTTPTSVPSGNSGDKITSLQAVIDEDETGVIDLSQYSDYTFTSYSATINKSITIKGANKDFKEAEITVNKDNVSLSGMKNVKSVTASASLGSGSMRISSSSVSNLNIYGGGSHSIYLLDDMSIDKVVVNKQFDDNEPVRIVLDASSAAQIKQTVIQSSMLLDASGDDVELKNVIFDAGDGNIVTVVAISSNLTLYKVAKRVNGVDYETGEMVSVTLKNDSVSTDASITIYVPKGTSVADLSADFIISAFAMIASDNTLDNNFVEAIIENFTGMMTEIFGGDTIEKTKDIKITVSEGNQIKVEEVKTTPTEETAQYTIKYLFQKVIGDGYESLDGYVDQTKDGTTDTTTDVTATPVTGFELQTIVQQKILANGSTVVEVKYNRKQITYTFNAAGGKWGDNVDTTTDSGRYGADVAVPAEPTRDGYTFSKWNKTVPQTFGAENETFTAEWNEIPLYSITIANDIQNGTVSVSPAGSAAAGTTITLTAEPAANYILDTWSVTCGDTPVTVTDNQFVMPSGNVTVSASFVKAIAYRSASWDESQSKVVYTDLAKKEGEYTTVTDSLTTWSGGGWYVVENDVTINDRITVAGTANLILCDGATLTAEKGITLDTDNTLNIYVQNLGTGTLKANAYNYQDYDNDIEISGSGIGGVYSQNQGDETVASCGTVNIHGGNITVSGGEECAGIGSAGEDSEIHGGIVTIYGGTVKATGGSGAAGIGGRGNGGTLIVYEGTITCIGGSYAAGIGTGYYEDGGIDVTIMGGIVTAQGEGAGIGAGQGGATHGPLTLGDGMIVVDQSGNEIDYTTSRPSYMQVKPRP